MPDDLIDQNFNNGLQGYVSTLRPKKLDNVITCLF